jgi:hypothetical protein
MRRRQLKRLASAPIASPPDLGRRYWCRSLPHIPEAFISTTTSWTRRRVGKFHQLDLAFTGENRAAQRFLRSVRCQTKGPSLRFFAAVRYSL